MDENIKLIKLPHLVILGAGASIASSLYPGYIRPQTSFSA
jgi:hypothetical protein